MRAFDYRLRVAFEDTNLLGNVYYANHVRWQGRCREMFLLEHAPQVVDELGHGLALATTRVACDYYQDLRVFDEVVVRMRAGAVTAGRLSMLFEYWRVRADGGEELVARGEQEVACLRRREGQMRPAPLPESLRAALLPFLDEGGAGARPPGPSGAAQMRKPEEAARAVEPLLIRPAISAPGRATVGRRRGAGPAAGDPRGARSGRPGAPVRG